MKNTVLFLIIAMNCIVLNAEVIKTKSIPLSLEVDFDDYNPTVTSMYLKCNMIEYESNIAKKIFASTDDKQTLMYRDLLGAFRNNDAERALKMTFSPRDEEKVTRYVNKYLGKTFSSKMVGEDFEKLYITRQLFVGDDRVIIQAFRFDWNKKNVLYSSFTRFKGDSQPKLWDYWVKDEYHTCDLYSLVSDTDQVLIRKPRKVKTLENVKTDYEVLLPCSTPENPAYLQFNGKVYNDFNVIKNTAKKNDAVLKFYQKACRLHYNEEYKKYADCHTKKGKARFLERIKKRKGQAGTNKKERIVQFILNADPLFMVFTKKLHGYDFRDHEYIIRTGKNSFKLAHLGVGGDSEHFFKNKKLFREPVLGPIIENHKSGKPSKP